MGGKSYREQYDELCQSRDDLLHTLEALDKRIEKLKELVRDEEDTKDIILSDTEFDDASVDPRYEVNKYRSNNIVKPEVVPIKARPGHVPGLIKQNQNTSLNEIKKREELQKLKMQKKIQADLEKKRALEKSSEPASLLSIHQKSKKLLKEQEQYERERYEKIRSEPIKSNFELYDGAVNLETVKSNRFETGSDDYDPKADPGFDIVSRMYISGRYLPVDFLNAEIGNTHVYGITRLYDKLPQKSKELMDSNFIVVGVLKKKSKHCITDNGQKYMKITLSDFKYDIVMGLWEDAYQKFWKIREGSICAILNPEIINFTAKNGYSANSMLRLSSSLCLLEYARFAHFGTCRGIKGHPCAEAIDTSRSHYCPYHLEKVTDKTASNRNEMGTNYKLFTPTDKDGNKQVLMVNDSELEKLELRKDHEEAQKSNGFGLAIENVKRNVAQKPGRSGTLVVDYASPATQLNMQSKEERHKKNFKSHKAAQTFLYPGQVNKAAIIAQEKNHELDLKLKKEQIERDANLKRKHEKEEQAMSYKQLKELQYRERKKELLRASNTKKTLRKDRATIQKLVENHARVDSEIKERKRKEIAAMYPNVKVHTSREERDIQLSSDSGSESELELE